MTETLTDPGPAAHEEDSRPIKAGDTVGCPECGGPATVEWRTQIGGTSGLLEHVKISCADRHWFFMPTYLLADIGRAAAPDGTSALDS